MRVLVTGATGFVGAKLCERLVSDGHELVALTRDPIRARERLPSPYDAYAWDYRKGPPPKPALEGVDWVFHLAGENIGARRWTWRQKAEILDSRILSTRNLFKGIHGMAGKKPAAIVSCSAVGFYGDRADELLAEESGRGKGFLSEVCVAWEGEAERGAAGLESRLVLPRFGMVLGPKGGALERLREVFTKGLGGRAGSGRQWMSWIHLADLVELLLFAAKNPDCKGPLNAVSPAPVRNSEFTEVLASQLGKPARFNAPAFVLKLAMGEMSELMLASQRVSSAKAERLGFQFKYPSLQKALTESL